jgi:hypothetical protein
MDAERFGNLICKVLSATSRRGVFAGIGWSLLSALPIALRPQLVAAKKKPKKKKNKRPCGGGCPKGFYCCQGEGFADRCCPYALGQCCTFGCCVLDPNMVYGNSEISPCVYVAGAGPT